MSTAAVVIEIVSPDDETYGKFAFYAQRANELIVVDPTKRAVECHVSDERQLVTSEGSALLGVSAARGLRSGDRAGASLALDLAISVLPW